MPFPYDVSYPLTIIGSNVIQAADGTPQTVLAQLSTAIPDDDCKVLDLQSLTNYWTWVPVLSGNLNLSGNETVFMRVGLSYPGDPSPPLFIPTPYAGELQPRLMPPLPTGYYPYPWDFAPPGAVGNFQFNLYGDASHPEYLLSHRSDCQFLIYGNQFFPGVPIGVPGFDVTVSDLLVTLYRHPATLFLTPIRFYANAGGQPGTMKKSVPEAFTVAAGSPQTVSFPIPLPPSHNFPFPAGVWASAYWTLSGKGQIGGTDTVDVGGNTTVFPARAVGGVFNENYLVASASQMALIRAAAGGNLSVTLSTTDSSVNTSFFTLTLLADGYFFKVSLYDAFEVEGGINRYSACCYTPTPDVEWIHIGAMAGGCGQHYGGGDPVWFAIDPNPTGFARDGHIEIDISSDVIKGASPGQHITIHQTGYGPHGNDLPSVAVISPRQADVYAGLLAVAWVTGDGKLYTSVHRGPQKVIGQSGGGWEEPQQVEAANASDCGIAYLPNGVLYLCYDLSGAKKYRTNAALGSSGFWSAAGTPSPAVSRHSAVGRGQGQAFRFRALGAVGASGSVDFSQCRDNRGAAWTSPVTAVTGARGPFCGGVWLGNGYGLLYTEHSTGKARWLKATDPANWPAGPGADTGMVGQMVGLTLTSAGVLIGLLWDWDGTTGNKRFRACRSRDRGATWEKDSADIPALPALDTPPAVVSLEQTAYAVYVVNNTPQFAASIDSGVSWQ